MQDQELQRRGAENAETRRGKAEQEEKKRKGETREAE
jgi:hypothetical protein